MAGTVGVIVEGDTGDFDRIRRPALACAAAHQNARQRHYLAA